MGRSVLRLPPAGVRTVLDRNEKPDNISSCHKDHVLQGDKQVHGASLHHTLPTSSH